MIKHKYKIGDILYTNLTESIMCGLFTNSGPFYIEDDYKVEILKRVGVVNKYDTNPSYKCRVYLPQGKYVNNFILRESQLRNNQLKPLKEYRYTFKVTVTIDFPVIDTDKDKALEQLKSICDKGLRYSISLSGADISNEVLIEEVN